MWVLLLLRSGEANRSDNCYLKDTLLQFPREVGMPHPGEPCRDCHMRVSQEAEKAKGKHGQEPLLCFTRKVRQNKISRFRIGYFE